ncbi:MAG: hypothetical protein A3E81_03795 [Gammaproteobacteria bacterium RIFCSPHIGHO2_12_FULL_36_30]|nr:MAG: hypothetical protein A3E81_03795 [Gammaproteobacteria bacterium RIFCSPHIGHO2_12_FULL_36_30]
MGKEDSSSHIHALTNEIEKRSAQEFLQKTARLTFTHRNRFDIFNTKTNREIEKLSHTKTKSFTR